MKAVIRQEWKARGDGLIASALMVLLLNGIAVALQHLDGVDLLASSHGEPSWKWILVYALTAISIFATWIIGPGNALIHYVKELERQLGGHSRSLLLTIPRTGATILGGKLAFGIIEFLTVSLLALLCSGVNAASMISVNSGKNFLAVVGFGWSEIFVPNLLPLGFLLLLALVFYAFVYGTEVFWVMVSMFCRSKSGTLLTGGVVSLYAGLHIALGHRSYWALGIPMVLLLLLQLPFAKVGIARLTCFLLGIMLFIDWPLRAIASATRLLPWKCEVSCHLPLMATKEMFCKDSFDFINGFLRIAESFVNNNLINLPLYIVVTLSLFAVAYFIAAAWYFTHRLEE